MCSIVQVEKDTGGENMNKAFTVLRRKKGFKNWVNERTFHKTRPMAEQYANQTRKIMKTPTVTMETKVLRVPDRELQQFIRDRDRLRRRR